MAHTRESVTQALETSRKFRERALLALYERQTAEEKAQKHTGENNGVGFTKWDANLLTSFAEQVRGSAMREGFRLSDRQHAVLQNRLPKYWRQFIAIAEERAVSRVTAAIPGWRPVTVTR